MIMAPLQLDSSHAEHIFSPSPRARATAASRNTNESLRFQQLKSKTMRCSQFFFFFFRDLLYVMQYVWVYETCCTAWRHLDPVSPIKASSVTTVIILLYALKRLTMSIHSFISYINICDILLKKENEPSTDGLIHSECIPVASHLNVYDPHRSVSVQTS